MALDFDSSEYLQRNSEKAEDGRGEMINEANITADSRPVFEVYLKGRRPSKEILQHFYSDDVTFQNGIHPSQYAGDNRYSGAYFCEYGRDLTGIEFEAGAVGARHGTVSINDPLGVWPEIIGHVSEFSTGAGQGQPNMLIRYGWTNHIYEEERIKEYWSIIVETNFELDENGLMKLTIKFVEGSISSLKAIKFLSLKDMYMTDPSTNDELEENAPETVDEILQFMIDNTSIGTQLAKRKMILQFEECSRSENDVLHMEDYSVRFGDSFYSMINRLTAKAMPPEDKDTENKDWIYRVETDRMEKIGGTPEFFGQGTEWEFAADEGDIVTLVRYEWVSSDKETEEEEEEDSAGTSYAESHNAVYLGNIVLKNTFEGEEGSGMPDYYTGTTTHDKTALSFNLDMRPFGALHGIISSQLKDTLKAFNDSDWNTLKGDVETFLEEDESRDIGDFEATREDGWWITNWGREGEEAFAERRRMYDELKSFSIEANTGESGNEAPSPVASKIRAWIKKFPLQATVEILGDPALGSDIPIGSGYFKIFFNTPSYFTDYLNGMEWLVMGIKHKIDDNGMFKTELKLIANMDKKEDIDGEGEDNNTALSPRFQGNVTG